MSLNKNFYFSFFLLNLMFGVSNVFADPSEPVLNSERESGELALSLEPQLVPSPTLTSMASPKLIEAIRQAKSEFDLVILKKKVNEQDKLLIVVAHRGGYENMSALGPLAKDRRYDPEPDLRENEELQIEAELGPDGHPIKHMAWKTVRFTRKVYETYETIYNYLRMAHPYPTLIQMALLGYVVFSDSNLFWVLNYFKGSVWTRQAMPTIQKFLTVMTSIGFAYGIYSLFESYLKPLVGNKSWYRFGFPVNGIAMEGETSEMVTRINNRFEADNRAEVLVVPMSYAYFADTTQRLVQQKDFEVVPLPAFLE